MMREAATWRNEVRAQRRQLPRAEPPIAAQKSAKRLWRPFRCAGVPWSFMAVNVSARQLACS
jgi:hypothetical protein